MRAKLKFYVGLILFCVGLFLPLLGLVVPFLNLPVLTKTVITGMLVVGGPEIFMILGVVFAGKETMNFIKKRFKSFFTKPVGRARHYTGVFMMLLSILASWSLTYFYLLTETATTDETKLLMIGCADLVFVASFFILGAPFWQKLTNLFTWSGTS